MERIHESLKGGGEPFLRGPMSASHGMPADEMCDPGKAAGLREKNDAVRSTFMIDAHFEGVLRQPSPCTAGPGTHPAFLLPDARADPVLHETVRKRIHRSE
jgi:hypothetical protein